MSSPRAALLVLLASLILAAPASALAAGPVLPGSFEVEARLPRRDGYSLKISTRGQRWVSISASHGPTGVSYTTKGHVDRDGIRANFGRFGRIDVSFRGGPWKKTKGEKRIPGVCKEHAPIVRRGTLRGTIRIHGRRGFVDLRVHRAQARMKHVFKAACKLGERPAVDAADRGPASILKRLGGLTEKGGSGNSDEELDVALLKASARGHGRRVQVLGLDLFGVPFLVGAVLREMAGHVP